VVRSGLFVELLEGARKWAAIEEEIAHEGVLDVEYVISLLQMAKGAFREDVLKTYGLNEDYSAAERTGCDCCQ
jgi:hypothetical protein